MNKQEADKFIASQIREYGLNGSNVTQNESKFPRLQGSSCLFFSKENHFVWGYSGNSYVNRRSSTCMYFTDYLKLPSTGSTLSLDRSLVDIAEQLRTTHGKQRDVMIANRGRFEDYAFIEASKEAGANFHQIVMRYAFERKEHTIPYDSAVPHTTFYVTPDLLLDVARVVVPWLRTKSIDVIQDIAVSRALTEEHLIYPSRMKFVNHNHDGEKVCGPANWALCDAEEDTALLRHDWFEEGMTHITANLATWSPELMASQLDHLELKSCMTSTTTNADLATTNMWKSVSPEQDEFTNKPRWWEEVQEEINEMHDGGKCNEKWFTPLHPLLNRVGVEYPQEVTDGSYGTIY